MQTAIQRAKNDPNIAREYLVELTLRLQILPTSIRGNQRLQIDEEAITNLNEVLQTYTVDNYPQQYARVHRLLGNVYIDRFKENAQQENLEQAIASYQGALKVYIFTDQREQYAKIQANCANAYSLLSHYKEGRDNQERAIQAYNEVLEVFTYDNFPEDFARIQRNLGSIYSQRLDSERRDNLEKAIACFQDALRVFTPDSFPIDFALTQYSLGSVYSERLEGERRTNLEHSILCYKRALEFLNVKNFPIESAHVLLNLGTIYSQRLEGEQQDNEEQAIIYCNRALETLVIERFPHEFALAHYNLGTIYSGRLMGTIQANQKESIAHYEKALNVFTLHKFPTQYAAIHNNLGSIYLKMTEGNRSPHRNQEVEYHSTNKAIHHYREALSIFTLETFPLDYARTQHNLGDAYKLLGENKRTNYLLAIECYKQAIKGFTEVGPITESYHTYLRLALAEAEHNNWDEAHKAYRSAINLEDLLIAQSSDSASRRKILQEGRDIEAYDSYTLIRLGSIQSAVTILERGCQRWLIEFSEFDTTSSMRIKDLARRKRYEETCERLASAQAALNAPLRLDAPIGSFHEDSTEEKLGRSLELERIYTYKLARQKFDAIVQEIRQTHDPADFLFVDIDPKIIEQAAKQRGTHYAVVYLTATPWGGIAIGAFGSSTSPSSSSFSVLELPELTYSLVSDLMESKIEVDDKAIIVGGFAHALCGNGFSLLLQNWKSETLQDCLSALKEACKKYKKPYTLYKATKKTLARLKHLANQPLEQISLYERQVFADQLNDRFLHYELERCLKTLANTAICSLADWLHTNGIREITIIPYGHLAAFPLAATVITERKTLGDLFITSIAPNAQSLVNHDTLSVNHREGIYAMGDPLPSKHSLPWSQAQALALIEVASNEGLKAEARVQYKATKGWLIHALNNGLVVNASCYCTLNNQHPSQSRLSLAKGETLTLRDVLNEKVNLHDLRLLILSFCRTTILGQREIYDEIQRFAGVILHAGVSAILISYWTIDDEAAYLLMLRFAQEWFPRINKEPPSAALARAKQWLRSITNNDLLYLHSISHAIPADEKSSLSGLDISIRKRFLSENPNVEELELLEAASGYTGEFGVADAEKSIRSAARDRSVANARPYADPIYWAGFQIFGW